MLSASSASAEQLTAAQYKSVMDRKAAIDARHPAMGTPYAKLTNPHKALAACIDWSKVSGDKVLDGPMATMGGNDLDAVKKDVLASRVALEKSFNCKCVLVDVDGQQAQ